MLGPRPTIGLHPTFTARAILRKPRNAPQQANDTTTPVEITRQVSVGSCRLAEISRSWGVLNTREPIISHERYTCDFPINEELQHTCELQVAKDRGRRSRSASGEVARRGIPATGSSLRLTVIWGFGRHTTAIFHSRRLLSLAEPQSCENSLISTTLVPKALPKFMPCSSHGSQVGTVTASTLYEQSMYGLANARSWVSVSCCYSGTARGSC